MQSSIYIKEIKLSESMEFSACNRRHWRRSNFHRVDTHLVSRVRHKLLHKAIWFRCDLQQSNPSHSRLIFITALGVRGREKKVQFVYLEYGDGVGIHYYVQPHWHAPLLSHYAWLAAQALAACTCGQTVNQIQTFHSSVPLRGLDWPLFWPCGPFYRLRREQQEGDSFIVHREMKSSVSLTFD